MLILTRKVGESFLINNDIELIIVEVSGEQVKIGIKAPAQYKILRKELAQTIESNKQAAQAGNVEKMKSFVSNLDHRGKGKV